MPDGKQKKRIRSINQTVAFFKEMDPDTAISYTTIKRAVMDNKIPCVYAGSRILITIEDVEEYFNI